MISIDKVKRENKMFRKIAILSLALVWSAILAAGCSSPKEACGTGTTWDETAQKCVWTNDTKLRCSADTELKDGKCVPKVETCLEDQILDEKTGKCVNRSEQCGPDATLNKASGKCEPKKLIACGEGTKEENGKCVAESKLVCGTNTKEENGKCIPDPNSVCTDDAKFDTKTGKCIPKKVVECSGDTVNKNDKCIPKAEFCDAGTKLDEATGKCIVDEKTCDKGSQLDAQTGKCVVSDKVCTGNTVFANNQCVPKKEVCTSGTKFDETTKTCLPDATCKPGDTLVKGLCYSPATKIATEKDSDEAENNDPSKGGKANEITLKEAGKKTVFVGTIGEPQDLDGDNKPDQDIDVYTFKAKAGKWYKIYVQSMGLPAPAFIVRGLYDTNSKTWRYNRVSSLAQGSGPGRFVFIPEDGDYTISVAPSIVLASSQGFNPAGPFAYGPVGSKDWEYVGVVEEVAAPTATKLDVAAAKPTIKGDLAKLASENVYELTNGQPNQLFEVEFTTRPKGANPVLLVWDGSKLVSEGRLNTENKATISLPEAVTKVTLIVDWDVAWGGDTNYEGNLSQNGIGAEFTAVSGVTKTFKIKVKPLTLVVLTFQLLGSTDSYLNVQATDAQATSVYSDSFQYYDDVGAFFSEKGGDYTVTVTRSSTTPMPVRFLIAYRPVKSLGVDKKPGDKVSHTETAALKKNDLRYFFFSLKEGVDVNGVIEGGSGPNEDLDASVLPVDLSTTAITGQTAGNVTWTKQFLKAGGYLVEIIARVDLPKGYKLDLTFADPPPAEKEPNGTQQTANTYKIGTKLLAEYTANDKDFYKITLANDMAKGDILTIKVNSDKRYSSYKCRLVTGSNAVLWDNGGQGRYGCWIQVGDLLKGDYFLETEYTSSGKYAYDITSQIIKGTLDKEPNNDDQSAQVVAANGFPILGRIHCDNLSTSSATSSSCKKAEATKDTYDIEIPQVAAGESIILNSKFNGTYTPSATSSYKVSLELFDPGTNKVLVKGQIGGETLFDNKLVPKGRYTLRLFYDATTLYKYYDFNYEISLSKAKITVVKDGDATTAASNNTFAKAQAVTAQPVVILEGGLPASPKDFDYYKFTLAADVPTGKKLVFTLNQGPGTGTFGNTSSIQVHVYDGAQKLISEKTGYTGYPKIVEIAGAKKGDYFIMMDRASTSTSYSGNYKTKIEIK